MKQSTIFSRPETQLGRDRQLLRKSQTGVETVEVALTLGVFVTLIIIFLEMAFYLYAYISTGELAREAVRYAVVRGNLAALDPGRGGDAPATQNTIRDFVISRGLVSSVDVTACWPSDPDDMTATCVGSSPSLDAGVNNLPGMRVNITVSHNHQPLLLPQITLTATSQGTILY